MDFDHSPLHNELCNYLRKKLYKTKIVLDYHKRASIERATDSQEGAFRELELVVRRADDLLLKCMCKQSSWLHATLTLPNIKEEVLDIVLDLFFWKRMLKIAIAHSDKGGLAPLQYAVKALGKDEELHEKLLKADSPLQKAAEHDRSHLLDKLWEVKERHASGREGSTASIHEREYILSIYLLSYLTEEDRIATEVESQLRDIQWGEPLGSGAYGQVSEVKWLEQLCAMKRIQNGDPKEVKISRGCNHPNIVQFFWCWEQERTFNIIMERMPEDLSRHIKRLVERNGGKPFQLHVAIDIMLQIAKALRYLHNKKPDKIVHRDLKPSNILVRPLTDHSQGYVHVKLADFGVSKVYNMSVTASPMSLNKGTTVYAAPEIFNHQSKYGSNSSKLPPKIDVWSFAMVCSEILTGTRPFDGEPLTNLHAKIEAMDDMRPPLPSDCPEDLRHCITRCWECDPRKRPTFIEVCKMLKTAKAQSLGIIHFNSSKRSASFNQTTVNNPTSRLLTSESQAAGSRGDSNVEMTGGLNENREVEQISSAVARCSLSLSGPLSDSEMVDPVEAVDTDHVAASPDQAVEGDVSNRLGHGARNSPPTSEPQAKGVDLPKAGLTVADSATIPSQGTTPRNHTSSQPMMIIWNDEEERRPPDSSRVSRPQVPLLPQDYDLCGEQGHQFRQPHYSSQHEAKATRNQLVDLDLFPEMVVGLQQSRTVTTATVQLTTPTKGTTGVTKEGVQYPAPVPIALPPHSVTQHSTGTDMRQMSWPPYGGLLTSGMTNSSSEVQPSRANSAGASDVEKKAGLEMITTATVQLTIPPKGTTGVTQEGVWDPAPVPVALPPHSSTQHSTGTDMRQMSWPPYGGLLLTSGMTNSSSEVQPSRANSAGASDVEKKAGLEMITTATVQLTIPPKGTTGVTQEGVWDPAPVPVALPPHSSTQYSTGTDMRQMSWQPYGGLPTSGMTNLSSEVQPSRANAAGASDVEKKGGLEMVTTETVQLTIPPKGTTGVTQEGVWYPATVPVALPPHSSTQHSTGTDMRQMSWPPYGGLSTSGMTNLSSEVQPSRGSSASASDVEKKGGLEMVTTTTTTVQLITPLNETTGVTQEGVCYPATVLAALPPHSGMQHSSEIGPRQMTWPPYGELPTFGTTNLSLEVQPPRASSPGASDVEKKEGLDNERQHGRVCGDEGRHFREPHYIPSLMDDDRMRDHFPESPIPPTTEPAPAVSSQKKAKATSNQLVDLDLPSEMGVGLPQPRTVTAATLQPTTLTKGTTRVTQSEVRYPAAVPPALPPHSGTQHSTGTGLRQQRQQMTWPPSGGLATSGRTNLSSEMQLQGAGSAGASNVEYKAGLENGPKEGHQLREPHSLLSLTDEWLSGQFPQSSTAHTPEPVPAVSSQNEAKATRNQLVDLDLFPEMAVGLQQSRMAATAAFQPTSPMKGTTGVNQEGIWCPAAGSVVLPTHSGTQHSTGTVYEGLGTSGWTNLSSEVQPRGAGSADASNVEKKGGQENRLFDITQHTHMGQMTWSPYGGLPASGRTKSLSEVQPQPPRADFASGSNVEKKGGLVDDGQRQLQNPSKNNPPLHSGLSGADSNLVAAMGQNTTPNPTFKPPQAQIALQQDKPMPQYAELMAKEEERKKSTVCKKELNQLQHDLESEKQNKRRKSDSPP